jgi:uncharacterized coiled-coil DUF342 family protein
MDAKRIKQIQEQTAFPDSRSVQQALLRVWNECEQQSDKRIAALEAENARLTRLRGKDAVEFVETQKRIEGLKAQHKECLQRQVTQRARGDKACERIDQLEAERDCLRIEVADLARTAREQSVRIKELED